MISSLPVHPTAQLTVVNIIRVRLRCFVGCLSMFVKTHYMLFTGGHQSSWRGCADHQRSHVQGPKDTGVSRLACKTFTRLVCETLYTVKSKWHITATKLPGQAQSEAFGDTQLCRTVVCGAQRCKFQRGVHSSLVAQSRMVLRTFVNSGPDCFSCWLA